MPTTEAILLDTHALIWWQAASTRLSATAGATIDSARHILVSPISCWELAVLARAGTIALDRPAATWFNDLFTADRIDVAHLTPSVGVAAAELPVFHGDPADRMIYATAAANGVPLVSKDRTIRSYARDHRVVTVIW